MQHSRYQPIRKLAIGGMGHILLARQYGHDGVERLVALKYIRADLSSHPWFRELFLNEARVAAKLSHPNIVHIYDFGNDPDNCFLAMEYVPGRSLQQVLRRSMHSSRLIPFEAVFNIALDLARGLHYAHDLRDEAGEPLEIVHRDLSPANVMVSLDGCAKILDFGVAKARIAQDTTERRSLKGHLNYLAPEQVRLEEVDRRADIYALGILLWEMTTGRPLYELRDIGEAADTIGRRGLPNVPEMRRAPPGWEGLLRRALAGTRDQRYATARDLQRDIEEVARCSGHVVSNLAVVSLLASLFPEAALTSPAPAPQQLSVLAVDDEQSILDLIERSLRRYYRVQTASSVAVAQRTLSHSPFDIVISDERMPDGRGVDLLAEVARTSSKTARVMATAYAEPDLMLRAINEGHVHRFLTKPFRPPELLGVIDDLVTELRLGGDTAKIMITPSGPVPSIEEPNTQTFERPTVASIPSAGKTLSDPPRPTGPPLPSSSIPWTGLESEIARLWTGDREVWLLVGLASIQFDDQQQELVESLAATTCEQLWSHIEGHQLALAVCGTSEGNAVVLAGSLASALSKAEHGLLQVCFGVSELTDPHQLAHCGHEAETNARTTWDKEYGHVR